MNDKQKRVVIFAKYPTAGQVKTRLIPAIGAESAARLATLMLRHTLEQVLLSHVTTIELCTSPDPQHDDWQGFHLPEQVQLTAQGEGDLGQRLARTAQRVIEQGDAVIFIGTDCPTMSAAMLNDVSIQLTHHDAVMIPASDGGYVLLAINQFSPTIFMGIEWSTDRVASDTLAKMKALGWSVSLLPRQHDIDEPKDLDRLPKGWLTQGVQMI